MRAQRRRRSRFERGEDLNPMNYLSNLSDVMLVLAVGIMVALILHWNVPIAAPESTTEQQGDSEEAITFTDDELDSQDEIPENMQHMGEVYYDEETGTYYILERE